MDKKGLVRRALLEKLTDAELPWWRKLYQKIFHPGQKICDVCGYWVENTEVPVHTTSRGGSFVHNIHVITSTKGRATIKAMSKMSKKEIESRVM